VVTDHPFLQSNPLAWRRLWWAVLLLAGYAWQMTAHPRESQARSLGGSFPRTIVCMFEQHTEGTRGVETKRGTFFFNVSGAVHIVTSSPSVQHVHILGKEMTLYYPREQKAYVIRSQNAIEPPILSPLLLATTPDFGLSSLGYSLERDRVQHDTVMTFWVSKDDESNIRSEAVITASRGRTLRIDVRDSATASNLRLQFENFVKMPNGRWLPLQLKSQKQAGDQQQLETTSLSEVRFNQSEPDSIRNFALPSGITPQQMQW
jgi:hypothetical protein